MRIVDVQHSVAEAMVQIAERIADALGSGGRLLVDGRGRGLADARHVVVEFMHPVTVGKRALPAFQGHEGRRDGDVSMTIAYGDSVDAMINSDTDIVLTDRPGGGSDPQLVLALPTDLGDAKITAVLGYHVVWELVHVFLESTSITDGDPPAASTLYPMLYAGQAKPDAGPALRAEANRSARAKITESNEVRAGALALNADRIDSATELVARAGTVFTIGNGGSSTDASDAAMTFGPGARSLADDVATISALANDVAFDVVFARQLATVGRPDDCLVAFSTSGSSSNVIEAARVAKRIGMTTVGLAGYDGGEMLTCDSFDVVIVVASDSVHRIQESHSAVINTISARLSNRTGGVATRLDER